MFFIIKELITFFYLYSFYSILGLGCIAFILNNMQITKSSSPHSLKSVIHRHGFIHNISKNMWQIQANKKISFQHPFIIILNEI